MLIKNNRRAKIVATLGPTSNTEKIIAKIIDSGVDIARLNFSHGSQESHLKLIRLVRKVSAERKKPVVILQDLQGPKLRVGKLPDGGVELVAGEIIRLELDIDGHEINFHNGHIKTIYLDVPDILHCLDPGGKILFDDGKLELEIIQIENKSLSAKVILGGTLLSNKGVNLPGANLDIPGFTDKDKEDLLFGLEHDIDAVALSFVRTKDDISCVREFISNRHPEKSRTPLIAKLELPQAIENLQSILSESDGVMVARGDLGVEMPPSEVPIIQKEIILAANAQGKLVITATQMLDSMVSNPRPTRAEASDVANAILDGTDAVMLSGETANGKYPIKSVQMMDAIVRDSEQKISKWGYQFETEIGQQTDDAFAISIAARELAHDRQVSSVAVFTQSGRSALLQSKARPDVPILAFTPNDLTYRTLGLYWGVTPHMAPFSDSLEDMIRHVEKALLRYEEIQEGEKVILISGFPIGAMRPTNLALLHTIGTLPPD